jgi:biopolymer transport protein ExbB
MDLTKEFVAFAQLGATWVLWVLVLLSVLSIGVMIDRALWFRGRILDTEQFTRELRGAFARDELERFEAKYKDAQTAAAQVTLAGLAERKRGPDAVAEAMQGERVRWRGAADRHLIVLGTLGNNVPFIGLFGTVLGVVDAFEHLREHTASAEDQTLDLIARALAATAFGLLVAIPAVIAYNYFTRRRGAMLSAADECAHAVLCHFRGDTPAIAPAAAAKAADGGG